MQPIEGDGVVVYGRLELVVDRHFLRFWCPRGDSVSLDSLRLEGQSRKKTVNGHSRHRHHAAALSLPNRPRSTRLKPLTITRRYGMTRTIRAASRRCDGAGEKKRRGENTNNRSIANGNLCRAPLARRVQPVVNRRRSPSRRTPRVFFLLRASFFCRQMTFKRPAFRRPGFLQPTASLFCH